MFRQQLRAILRASAHGQVRILIPMVAHLSEIRQTLEALGARARSSSTTRGRAYGAGRARRDDRGAGGGADAAGVPAVTSTSSRSAPTT